MYNVVGCGECGALWLITDVPETTQCPRCGTRHSTDNLRILAASDDQATARQARAQLLASRQGVDDPSGILEATVDVPIASPSDSRHEADDRGDPDLMLTDHDQEAGSARSQREILMAGLRDLDEPTHDEILEFATARGISAEYVESALEKLVRDGAIRKESDTYRLL